MKSAELHPSDMNHPDLNKMRASLNEQAQRLRRAAPKRLRVVVDRHERGVLDLGTDSQARFTLTEGDEFLELRTLPEEGDLRLALYPIDYARLERAQDADEFVLALADGRKLNFAFTPQRDEHGEITGAIVTASHRPTAWQRWRQNLFAVVPSAPNFSYALTAALLLIGLTGGVLLWQLLRADSPGPNIGVNKPPATDGPNGGANNGTTATPSPIGAQTPAVTAGGGKPPRPQNSPPAPRPPLTREPDVVGASAAKSVSEVKQIFIPVGSGGPAAAALREELSRQLQASGRWTIASQEEADAALNIVVKSEAGASAGQTSSVQLVNASGKVVWPAKGEWRIYSGEIGQIAKQVVNDLLKATR